MAISKNNAVAINPAGSANTIVFGAILTVTGNLIVVHAKFASGATVSSVTDTAGNAYVGVPGAKATASDGSIIECWYAKNITGNAANVTTVNLSSSVAGRKGALLEYTGLSTTSPLDQANVGNGTGGGGTNEPAAASVSTVFANEAIVSYCYASGGTLTAGSGYTEENVANNANKQEDQIVSATGSFTGGWTLSASNIWAVSLVTFSDGVGGPTGHPTMRRWGGVPHMAGNQQFNSGDRGTMWGRSRSGLFVPHRFLEAA